MPSEPDQTPIEGLLKSYAKKRAEDASGATELHPATRRLLQGEVTKLRLEAQAAGGRSWMQWLILFWPRLATASAILVMLLTGVWMLLPDSQPSPTTFARNEDAPYRMPLPGDRGSRDSYEQTLAPAKDAPMSGRGVGEPASAPALAQSKGELNQRSTDRVQDEKRLAEQESRAKQVAPRPDGVIQTGEMSRTNADRLSMIAANPVPADASKQNANFLADAQVSEGANPSALAPATTASSLGQPKPAEALALNRAFLRAPAPSPAPQPVPAPAAPTPSAPLVVADAIDQSNGKLLSYRRMEDAAPSGGTAGLPALNLRFVQADKEQKVAALKTSPDAEALLGNFQLVREGKVVRVIDGDGSIYVGQMVDSAGSLEAGRNRVATPSAPAGATAANNPQFRVAGVHRTSGRAVVFEGSLLANSGSKEQVETLSKSIEPAPKSLELRSRALVGATPSATASVSPSDRVVGTVRVNGTNIFPIRAASVPR